MGGSTSPLLPVGAAGGEEGVGGSTSADGEEGVVWQWAGVPWTVPTAFNGLGPVEIGGRTLGGISQCDVVVSARIYAPVGLFETVNNKVLILDFSQAAHKLCTENKGLHHVVGHHYVSHVWTSGPVVASQFEKVTS